MAELLPISAKKWRKTKILFSWFCHRSAFKTIGQYVRLSSRAVKLTIRYDTIEEFNI